MTTADSSDPALRDLLQRLDQLERAGRLTTVIRRDPRTQAITQVRATVGRAGQARRRGVIFQP